MINQYLDFLQESTNIKNFPKDLINYMLEYEMFNHENKIPKTYSQALKSIDFVHKQQIEMFNSFITGKNWTHKEVEKWNIDLEEEASFAKKGLDFIKKMNLYCIFSYGNGDYAYFSFKDKKVYDHGHEGNGFYPIKYPEFPFEKKRCWPPTPYKQWLKDVSSGKHQDSWR